MFKVSRNKNRHVTVKVPHPVYLELRVCVLGSADVGKSTLLGVLTQAELNIFIFRTKSVCTWQCRCREEYITWCTDARRT